MPELEQIFSQAKNSFSACHFLVDFDKCDRLHGHNYSVTVKIKYSHKDLTSTIDFRSVNAIIRQELQLLDQKILLPKKSSKIKIHSSLDGMNWEVTVINDKTYSFPKQDTILLNGIEQTTTEGLAFYLHQRFSSWLNISYPDLISSLDITIAENLGNQVKYSGPV
ncbi:MAG: 6-carboxytetrahydropterin synthase [Candidatus Heimdallarchaeota archaeon]|nr:MAG: 6-carboxytetrahydropterin synthase [Candidatus Heimdallarchaeota archaeon]